MSASFLHLRHGSDLLPAVFKRGNAAVSSDWLINSAVMDVTLALRSSRKQASRTVLLYLRHYSSRSKSVCAFWNHTMHYWSTEGCVLLSSNSSHTVCSCTHLTAFALLKPRVDVRQGLSLSWLAAVSCGVSIAISLLLLVLVVSYQKRTVVELSIGYASVCFPYILLQVMFLVSPLWQLLLSHGMCSSQWYGAVLTDGGQLQSLPACHADGDVLIAKEGTRTPVPHLAEVSVSWVASPSTCSRHLSCSPVSEPSWLGANLLDSAVQWNSFLALLLASSQCPGNNAICCHSEHVCGEKDEGRSCKEGDREQSGLAGHVLRWRWMFVVSATILHGGI